MYTWNPTPSVLVCKTQFHASAVAATFIFYRVFFQLQCKILFPRIFTKKAHDFVVSLRNDPVISGECLSYVYNAKSRILRSCDTVAIDRNFSFISFPGSFDVRANFYLNTNLKEKLIICRKKCRQEE